MSNTLKEERKERSTRHGHSGMGELKEERKERSKRHGHSGMGELKKRNLIEVKSK